MFAFSSLRFCRWAREYYDMQRKREKTNSVAIRALSNKWVKGIFSMWKNETEYKANTYPEKNIYLLLDIVGVPLLCLARSAYYCTMPYIPQHTKFESGTSHGIHPSLDYFFPRYGASIIWLCALSFEKRFSISRFAGNFNFIALIS
jgi:hypothetical protein